MRSSGGRQDNFYVSLLKGSLDGTLCARMQNASARRVINVSGHQCPARGLGRWLGMAGPGAGALPALLF